MKISRAIAGTLLRNSRAPLLLVAVATLQACSGAGGTAATAVSTVSDTAAAVATAESSATPTAQMHTEAVAAAVSVPVQPAGVDPSAFSSYEVAQVHPLDITPDGTKLLVTNTANGTLEVFSVAGSTVALTSVIKVGVEPISVRAASNTQAWVVNEVSDSVSVVDIANNQVIATLQADDEPADVVFAGSPRRAYVSVAQSREILEFDLVAPTIPVARIPILGQQPRALATSADGSKVYLAIFESGNGTTAMTGGKNDYPFEVDIARSTSNPYAGVSPFPDLANGATYTSLYGAGTANPPPPVSVIVRRNPIAGSLPQWLDANGKDWSPFINGSLAQAGTLADRVPAWDLIDRDVAIIDTVTRNVSYQGGPLNIVMGMAVNPATGAITTIGTDATNQIRYENVLDGKFIKVLFGSYVPGSAGFLATDLNPHLTYKTSSIPAACPVGSTVCRANSVGDPRGIAWNAAGTKAYVTGMGSNNLIVINAAGARAGRARAPIAVGQGPTSVVLQESQARAFVLNRFDATLSVLSLTTETETARVALSYDPTPTVIRVGRPMLYNTQTTSGLGQMACASCHVDSRTDRLAWDLGNPTATMSSSLDTSTTPATTIPQHPMKGPLLTMTLDDDMQSPFLHWRGDRLNLAAFAGAFQTLQGGDAPATTAQINAMHDFLATIRTPPNPFRNITNNFPTELAVPGPRGYPYRTGNAVAGAAEFEGNCRSCHPGNTNRGFKFVLNQPFGVNQYRNPPRWQNFYRRDGFWFSDATASTAGFGFQQDGTFDATQNSSRDDSLMAFMYSFNGSYPYTPPGLNATNVANDSHAAVGKQVTLSGSVTSDPLLAQLQTLASTQVIDLVASGCIAGETRGLVYISGGTVASAVFEADRGDTFTGSQLQAIAAAGSPITFTAVRRGTGYRIGIDANADGNLDGNSGITPTRVCSSGKAPNLLVNGSFETNGVAPGNWANTTITGWSGSSGVVQVWNGLFGYPAADGNSWLQIAATAANGAVSQTVSTVSGDALVLRFWYAARPGTTAVANQFNVLWNGTVIATLAPDGTNLKTPLWLPATYLVKASGKDTLSFAESGVGVNPTVGTLLDAVSLADAGQSPQTLITPASNLAYGKPATSPTIGWGTQPSYAVDGNIDGNYLDNSVMLTSGNAAQDWWQVDTGAQNTIQTVHLFGRTDCCATRLNNFYVFTSAADMSGQTLAQLLANPAVASRYVAAAGYVHENMPQKIALDFGKVTGRFVRVQLAGTNQLTLAEVEVMGWAPGAK